MRKTLAMLRKKNIWFVLGIVLVAVSGVVSLILQDDIVVNYHDQLDGEVIGYILHAKYLFQGVEAYPEMMNGISPNGLFPPSPLTVLIYRFMEPHMAFIVNAIFCTLCGYIGMYLCIKEITKDRMTAMITGVLFAYLPLLSVYGLCQYGLPMLFYALYCLYQKRHIGISLFGVALYGAMSSLVLIGYAVLGFGALFILRLLIKKEWKEHIWLMIGGLLLFLVYLLTNYELVLQVFGYGEFYVSHKEVIVRYGQDFWQSFCTIFFSGTVHTPTHQTVIAVYAMILILISLLNMRKDWITEKTELYVLYACYGGNLFFAFFYACYQSDLIAGLRNQAGGIFKEFQADRLFWLSVPLWYMIFGICLHITLETACHFFENRKKWYGIGLCFASALLLLFSAATVFYYSDFNKNLHRLKDGEAYAQITWKDFYAPDVFDCVDAYIGEDTSQINTLSFGIYPAAALYNGYNCLDGYSNNYSRNYMKQFREIIAGELKKSEKLADYFDQWGCRCYLLSAELGSQRFMYPKDSGISCEQISFDFSKAKEMGAEYVFSAIRLPHGTKGLELVRNEPFETDTSYYEIYLYKVK